MTVLSNPNNMDSRVFNLELGTPALRVRACPYVSQGTGASVGEFTPKISSPSHHPR